MTKKSRIEKQNEIMATAARVAGWVSVPVLAIFIAPVVAARDMYSDINYRFNKNIPLKYATYGEYYKDCIKNFVLGMPAHLENRARELGKQRLKPFDDVERKKIDKIIAEIEKLEQAGIVSEFENAPIIKVRLMQETEHQKRQLQRLETQKYMIDFGGNGTDWCGGIRGNGYVFKKNIDGSIQQISVISGDTSKYLHDILVANYNIKTGKSILNLQYTK